MGSKTYANECLCNIFHKKVQLFTSQEAVSVIKIMSDRWAYPRPLSE